jgi:hypothetical protein
MHIQDFTSKTQRIIEDGILLHDECEDLECEKDHSPFAPNHSCSSDSELFWEESSSSSSFEHCCKQMDDFGELPIIFDRRYDFGYRELCSRNFGLRLGGLRNRLASILRQYLGCKVELGYECESNVKKIKGKIKFVGSDFVEVLNKDHKNDKKSKKEKHNRSCKKGNYSMIPFDSINWMKFK